MKTEPGRRNGTAATADAVSCVPAAITAASPALPIAVPAGTTSGRSRDGAPRSSTSSTSQSPVRGSRHCVVDAFVRSDVRAPQSQ